MGYTSVYATIQCFAKRQRHTHAHIKSLMGHAFTQLAGTALCVLCLEDLQHLKRGTLGTFPRLLNRRLSHWLYNLLAEKLELFLNRKEPSSTAQHRHQ